MRVERLGARRRADDSSVDDDGARRAHALGDGGDGLRRNSVALGERGARARALHRLRRPLGDGGGLRRDEHA